MALDRQKILGELGSVMNQLQSVDCGCMGKLFNNTNSHSNMNNTNPGSGDHRTGCCPCSNYNSFSSPCNGQTYPTVAPQNMNHSCMGRCNPSKLYADTYQYLNTNLMQPVVQEVYNDLNTITPANTVMNNQPGNPMAASQGQTNMQLMQNKYGTNSENTMNPTNNQCYLDPRRGCQMSGVGDEMSGVGAHMSGLGSHINGTGGHMTGVGGHISGKGGQMNGIGGRASGVGGHMSVDDAHMGGEGAQMSGMGGGQFHGVGSQMAGMGPNIVNMIMGGNKSNANNKPVEEGMLTQPMVIDAPQSPHGKVGLVPIPSQINGNHSQRHPYNQHLETNQGNEINQMQFSNQNKAQMPNVSPNTVQQKAPKHNAYGQHTPGITKFNEMFPGVMQNLGGDLGFDPMAIAVQMNPNNHQRAAFDTMQKMMYDNKTGTNKLLNPTNPGPPPDANTTEVTYNSNLSNNNMPLNISPNQPQQVNVPTNQMNTIQRSLNQHTVTSQQMHNQEHGKENGQYQQVYSSPTPAPRYNNQSLQQQQQYHRQDQHLQQQSRYLPMDTDANGSNTIQNLSPNNEDASNAPKSGMQHPVTNLQPISEPVPMSQPLQMKMEPIFPADTSQNQSYSHMKRRINYTYNTLGQPVEMLPAESYHTKDPGGPQTLSPQNIPLKSEHDPRTFSNVKATVSKTSIMGNRAVGRNPSKAQLQNIYNQYKGSQSLTQQNMFANNERASFSEGQLGLSQPRAGRVDPNDPVLVEKFGEDTLPNNEVNKEVAHRAEKVERQIGDVPNTNKIPSSDIPEHSLIRKARNGLQDVIYTSYPSSAAWSFHGHTRPVFADRARGRTRF